MNYSLDLNEKNTILNLGWAHDSDTIIPNSATYIFREQHKITDDVFIGADQLLGPNTVLTANFTFGNSSGYLNDPYRGVLFEAYPQADLNNPSLFAEKRPNYRESYTVFGSVLQYVKPLRASAEGSYRFYADSFGIFAHTIGVAWHQKAGDASWSHPCSDTTSKAPPTSTRLNCPATPRTPPIPPRFQPTTRRTIGSRACNRSPTGPR